MYFPGFTPSTSKAYIADYDDPHPEFDTTMCCFRSHIGALRHFINNSHADYCIVMEDDVALLQSGFQTYVDNILCGWKDHPDIDYIVIGHLVGDKSHDFAQSCESFEWDPRGAVVWGFQAYIVRRESAARILSRFDKPNTAVIRKAAWEEIESRNGKVPYENRYPRIQCDSIIPAFFKAAYSKQLLGIEAPFTSIITEDDVAYKRWASHFVSGRVNPSEYYENGWTNIIATKDRTQ